MRSVAEAQRTIHEQYIIVRCSGGNSGVISEGHRSKLEMMLSGADLPDEDKNGLARNTQFELFAAAMFGMGEIRVYHGEPDFRFPYLDDEDVGLAVKRVSSTKQIRPRVKEGIEQIEKSGGRGFVAVNADVFVKKMNLAADDDSRGDAFNHATADIRAVFEEFKETASFLGLINFGYVFEWDCTGDPPVLGMHDFRQFGMVAQSDAEEADAMAFFESLWDNAQAKLDSVF